MNKTCRVFRLGLVSYEEAWELQDRLAREIAAGEREPALLLLEHPHTYTFGRSGHPQNLLWDEAELEQRGVRVHWVDRGGDVTYHGPGQLVGYPLLPLGRAAVQVNTERDSSRLPEGDYVGYLRRLEETLIAALAGLGVTGFRLPGLTGVWVRLPGIDHPQEGKQRPAKLAAIGVKVDSRGISRHGFALNVTPDMRYWEGIIGCGLEEYPVASLEQLLTPPPSMETVMERVVSAFGQVFSYEMAPAALAWDTELFDTPQN
jgi:lipoate-protein ligase B